MSPSSHGRISNWIANHSRLVVFGFLGFSVLLIVPLVTMAPDEDASQEPSGAVFELQEDIDQTFVSPIHGATYIMEARGGDALVQATLWELYQNQQALLSADTAGELTPGDLPNQPYLYQAFDRDTGATFTGVSSLANAVQSILQNHPALGVSLETASDEQVKLALHLLFANPDTAGLRDSLSVQSSSTPTTIGGEQIEIWTSPAIRFNVLADNNALGGQSASGLNADDTTLDKEDFNLNVQEILRGDESSYRLWGVAIDQNREIAAEGQIAGQFITFTVIAAVIVAGIAMRSYWAVALTGAGLGFLMIWLKGLSNLIGLEGGLIVSLIVPIAMISLGIDFAVHAVGRYREERQLGYPPRRAFVIGLGGVLSALVLAAVSDSVAFLSNTTSGIEAITHFGIAAAIATVSSFIVLGLVVPLTLAELETLETNAAQPGQTRRIATTIGGGAVVALLTGAAVIFFAAISPPVGAGVLALSVALTLVLPWLWLRRRAGRSPRPAPESNPETPVDTFEPAGLLPAVVTGMARARFAVVALTVIVTAIAGIYALRLEATFDVKDFFDSRSDFVVGLDKLDDHVGDRGGESGTILVAGRLNDPATLAALDQFRQQLESNNLLAHEVGGDLAINEPNALSTLNLLTTNPYAAGQVEAEFGVPLQDRNGDGYPDEPDMIQAALDYALSNGIPAGPDTLLYSAGEVANALVPDQAGYAARFQVSIPGSREQTNVTRARESLESSIATLESNPGIDRAGLTGSPFTRERTLVATTESLQRAIPIAATGAFVILLLVFRSVRFALVTVIPVGLVTIWLYAIMEINGLALNFVTATIGAISIGIGIDYSIHMTERYREELDRSGDRFEAVRHAAAGTGSALVASAASSIVGFAILGFAPMPMFASYGVLTAIMILLALLASLLVLPSLLVLATSSTTEPARTVQRQEPATMS